MFLNHDDCSAGCAGENTQVRTEAKLLTDKKKPHLPIPDYLQDTYWWAYLHPKAVRFFERQWLVNLILFGNYRRLQNAALKEIKGDSEGDVLQVACVYGDFSQQLSEKLSRRSQLHIIDVAPIQLNNTRRKLRNPSKVMLHHQDSSRLEFEESRFNTVIVFFLLHEQPAEVRKQTIKEAIRVTADSGKTIFIDYHRPKWYSPFRWIIDPVLRLLEPYAHDLWEQEIQSYLHASEQPESLSKTTFFLGQYQKVVITKSVS